MGSLNWSNPRPTGVVELDGYFSSVRPPYTLGDIRDFNLMYRRIYPTLSSEQRALAEEWVDAMIANVEREELASKIYGVV